MHILFISVLVLAHTLAFAGPPPKVTPELLAKGKASFEVNCLTCHGATGDGNGPAGQYMNPKPRNFGKDKLKNGDTPESMFKTVSNGLVNTAMVAFGHLPEEERWAIILYIRTTFMKK
ncbi:MAG: cytochrome c [Deltaproteobacteria bacterium]|nr:cytochrome c [Deltaproteobacteria bacterium]